MCHEGRASSTKFINPFIRCQIQSHSVSTIGGQCGEIEKMYKATKDIYILYIEEILSIIAVYTIHSSRPQSFLLSFSALCTIPHSAACIILCSLFTVLCISPTACVYSLCQGSVVLPQQSPRQSPTRIQQSWILASQGDGCLQGGSIPGALDGQRDAGTVRWR